MVIKWVKERRLWEEMWGPVGPMAGPKFFPINLHLPEPKLSDPGQMSDARLQKFSPGSRARDAGGTSWR